MRSPEPCSHTRGHRRHWVTLARAQADATVGRSLIQIRSDAAIAVQGQSPSPLPPAPHAWAGAGWAPVLRKPGNTLFSGLHAQIPGAVTGHAFSEPIQSHKHGPEASLGSGILWGHQQGHLDSQAHSWLGREVPADSQQAGAVVRSCGVTQGQTCPLWALGSFSEQQLIHSAVICQASLRAWGHRAHRAEKALLSSGRRVGRGTGVGAWLRGTLRQSDLSANRSAHSQQLPRHRRGNQSQQKGWGWAASQGSRGAPRPAGTQKTPHSFLVGKLCPDTVPRAGPRNGAVTAQSPASATAPAGNSFLGPGQKLNLRPSTCLLGNFFSLNFRLI